MGQGVLQFGGSWTKEKLDILRKYLHAYTTALKKQSFDLFYIDAFAGTGYCGKAKEASDKDQLNIFEDLMEEDSQAYITGSARIALEVEPPFSRYIYIDIDTDNCAQLGELKSEYPDKANRIEVVNADANGYIQQLVRKTNWQNRRAVMFLDPFAMQVRWNTVQVIAESGAIDLWYLFPISAVNRLLARPGRMQEGWPEKLNDFFGTTNWLQFFYKESLKNELFGSTQQTVRVVDWDGIMNYVVERLKAEYPYVAERPMFLVNPRSNTRLFLMCFAAANPKGGKLAVKIAQDIIDRMSK